MDSTLKENADYFFDNTCKGDKQKCLSYLLISQQVTLTLYAGTQNKAIKDIEETIKYIHSK
jgi:hypothetical protein